MLRCETQVAFDFSFTLRQGCGVVVLKRVKLLMQITTWMGFGGPRQEAQVVQDLPPHARKIKGEVCTPLKHLYSVGVTIQS